MYELSLFRHNRKLSAAELAVAKEICNEMQAAVAGRRDYMREHAVDAKFALPDANWSYHAPNEFVRLFARIAQASAADINRLRGFTQVFSGYSLFDASRGYGFAAADMQFDADFESRLAQKLVERNAPFIREHLALTQDLPPEYIFRPPSMLGEVGHIVDGVLVNNDTNTYQERINILYKSGLAERVREKIAATGEARICEIGGGWLVVSRPWAGGRALTHSGSNTMWYCTVWVAPARDFAVMVTTNQGDGGAAGACDEAVGQLIGIAQQKAPGV